MVLTIKRQRFIFISVLAIILLYSYTGELVAYNNGAGWDGELYFKIIRDFDKLIASHGIDAYHMTRFFPFAVLHYVLNFLGIPITIETAILSARVFNILCMVLLLMFFFKMSNLLKWSQTTEAIAFSFVFFNFPILKYFGYYPISCDPLAYLLSYAAIYYYLTKNNVANMIVGLLALMTWPILTIVIFILMIMPRNEVNKVEKAQKKEYKIVTFLRGAVIFAIPILGILYALAGWFFHRDKGLVMFVHYFCGFRGYFHPIFPIIAWAAFVFFNYVSTRVMVVDWVKIFKNVLTKKTILNGLAFGLLIIVAYLFLNKLGGEAIHSSIKQLVIQWQYPVTDILIFLETHFIYLGLFFVLTILLWNRIAEYVCKNFGVGYYFVIIMSLLFITEIETRKLVSFFPVILIPMMACFQDLSLKKWVVFLIPMFCLLTSFFWFNINTPDIAEAFNKSYSTYTQFPAQRYYMFFGPWQSHIVYMITAVVEIIVVTVIVRLHKKGLLYVE